MIRPIIGANGAGKTTQLEIQVKKFVNEIFQNKLIYLFFDFKYITDNEEDFWSIFMQRLYEQIRQNKYLHKLCSELEQSKLRINLIRKFKNSKVVKQIQNILSNDASTQAIAEEFIYGEKITKKDIVDFFNGFLNLALDLNKLVILCFDELQFLIDIDPTKNLAKIILEQFIRKLIEQFRNKRLYIIISCLQNPDKKEYDQLKEFSKNFKSIVEGKEIILGNLTSSEKEEILNQVCEKINMDSLERKKFLKKVKGRLDYFLPRGLLKSIAEILDVMGYTSYSETELRNLYEKESREYIKPILNEKGFIFMNDSPKKIGGFNVDIIASSETKRANRVFQAFGEVTIMNRKGMKGKVEKFASWLHEMKGKEYRPDLGDYAFFLCPKNRLTKSSKDVLESNNIEYYEFDSSLINEINHFEEQQHEIEIEEIPQEIALPKIETEIKGDASTKVKQVIIKKPSKFKLVDIPGVGAGKVALLKKANITTIEELISCDSKIVAKKVKGLGVTSLNKWIQKAKQIIND
ncbi:MAG: hypothetical protein ACTSO2_17440, partial [Promethearchaeota archaeon]